GIAKDRLPTGHASCHPVATNGPIGIIEFPGKMGQARPPACPSLALRVGMRQIYHAVDANPKRKRGKPASFLPCSQKLARQTGKLRPKRYDSVSLVGGGNLVDGARAGKQIAPSCFPFAASPALAGRQPGLTLFSRPGPELAGLPALR